MALHPERHNEVSGPVDPRPLVSLLASHAGDAGTMKFVWQNQHIHARPPGSERVEPSPVTQSAFRRTLLLYRATSFAALVLSMLHGITLLERSPLAAWLHFVGVTFAAARLTTYMTWSVAGFGLTALRLEPPRRSAMIRAPESYGVDWLLRIPCSPTVH